MLKALTSIAKSLIRISKNIARIKEILEIVFRKELELNSIYGYNTDPIGRDSDREFYILSSPRVDQYGESLSSDEELVDK